MTYSPRPRRFRKIAQARATCLGLITAREFLTRQGVPVPVADRFAGAFTRVVKKLGAVPMASTWTKRNGRARKTVAYNPATDLGALLGATVAVLDWLHLYACALTEEHICDRTAAEARYGFSVYAVDALREETHWARVELIGP